MSEIIQKSERVQCSRRTWNFQRIGDTRGSGFGFDVDETGKPVNANPLAKANFEYAVSHPDEYRDEGIKEERWSYWQPAVLRCDCGEGVELRGFTNTCDCGRDYNMSGQLLAPRAQWGEETGESLADILSIP